MGSSFAVLGVAVAVLLVRLARLVLLGPFTSVRRRSLALRFHNLRVWTLVTIFLTI